MTQREDQEIARLRQLNAELSRSLQRCRALVAKWRSGAAAGLTEEDRGDAAGGRSA